MSMLRVITLLLGLGLFALDSISHCCEAADIRYVVVNNALVQGGTVRLWDSEQSANTCSESSMKKIEAEIETAKLNVEKLNEAKRQVASSGSWDKDSPKIKEIDKRLEELELIQNTPLPPVCDEAKIGSLTNGTRVRLLHPSNECGDTMSKVRVLMGKYVDKVGCVANDALGINQ